MRNKKTRAGRQEVRVLVAALKGSDCGTLLKVVGLCFLALFFSVWGNVQLSQAADNTLPGLCYDIDAKGVNYDSGNSGVIEFETKASYPYQMCVDSQPTGSNYDIDGWAWNTNVGWISASCPGGLGAKNLGVECGSIAYKSTINGSTGELRGYWWGDGTGWMALNCLDIPGGGCNATDGNFKVQVETSGVNAGKVMPGKGYAWSENLGWIDLAGMEIPWVKKKDKIKVAPVTPPVTWSDTVAGGASDPNNGLVYAYLTPNPKDFDGASAFLNPIAADGTAKYKLRLHLEESDGSAIDGAEIYTISVNKSDNIKTDQVSDSGSSAISWGGTAGAPGKANFTPAGGQFWEMGISSVAPTSNFNGIDKDADKKFDCYYGNSGRTATHTGEACTTNASKYYAQLNTPTPVDMVIVDDSDVNYLIEHNLKVPVYGDPELKFAPAIDVPQVSVTSGQLDTNFRAARNQRVTIYYKTAKNSSSGISSSQVKFEVSADDDDMDLVVLSSTNEKDADQETATPSSSKQINTYNVPSSVIGSSSEQKFFVIPRLRKSSKDGASPEIVDPRIKAYVEYNIGGIKVRYPSAGMPWVKTRLFNPGVDILSGSVNVQGVVKVADNVDVRAVSNIGTDEVRNVVLQNVKAFLAGIDKPKRKIGGYILNQSATDAQGKFNNNSGLKIDNGNAAYFHGDVSITDSKWWKGNRTIIIEGGHLTIDSNLIENQSNSDGQLAIVVLEDRSEPNADKRGGNVYIHPDVTDLYRVNIYADGSIFSYNPSSSDQYDKTTGEPDFDEATCENLLVNQLYIYGSIASKNTIGGADRDPVVIGSGLKLGSTASTIAQRNRAKLYDWNYIRCFSKRIKVDSNGMPVDADGPDLNGDGKPDGDGEADTEPSGKVSPILNKDPNNIVKWAPVVIDYNPARPEDLPVFSTGGSSSFGVQAQ